MQCLQDIMVKPGDRAIFDIDKTVSATHILELLFFLREQELSVWQFFLWKVWMYGCVGPWLKLLDRWSRPHAQSIIYRWYERYTDEELLEWSSLLFRERLLAKCYPAVRDWLYELRRRQVEITFISTNLEPVAQAYAHHFGGACRAVSLAKLRKLSGAERINYLELRKQRAVVGITGNIVLGVGDSRYDEALLSVADYGVVIRKKAAGWMGPYWVFDRVGELVAEPICYDSGEGMLQQRRKLPEP